MIEKINKKLNSKKKSMRDKMIKICKKNLQGNPYKEAWEKN